MRNVRGAGCHRSIYPDPGSIYGLFHASVLFRTACRILVGFIVSAYVTGKVCEKLKASYKNYLLACLAGFVVTYAIGIVYKFIILNFYAHTPATLGVIFLSCFPLDMPGDFVLCLLAAGVGLRMRKSGFYLSE